jgi:hypothetical protein
VFPFLQAGSFSLRAGLVKVYCKMVPFPFSLLLEARQGLLSDLYPGNLVRFLVNPVLWGLEELCDMFPLEFLALGVVCTEFLVIHHLQPGFPAL